MDLSESPIAGLIFIITLAVSLYAIFQKRSLISTLAFKPYFAANNNKWFTIVTSGFVHLDIPHLLFNMMSFYFFAFRLESIIGSVHFAIIYMGSLILSDIPTFIKNKENPNYMSLGASGAISGVLFSYILFDPMTKLMIFPLPIGIPAYIFSVLYLAWCYYAGRNSYDNINHSAHLWGALSGLLLTVILVPEIITYFINNIRF